MRNSPYCVIAVKTIILSIFGLSTLPFWAVVVQFIDSVTGFSSGQGYHSASQRYIFESPLIYILVVLCINVVAGMHIIKKRKVVLYEKGIVLRQKKAVK